MHYTTRFPILRLPPISDKDNIPHYSAPSCSDGAKNQDESDVDCGGSCQKCKETGLCVSDTDCATGWCNGGKCVKPSCFDHLKNQDETDVDCGGICAPCGEGMNCTKDAGCLSGYCINKKCQIPSCSDGVKNQNESKMDCGGPCPACAPECLVTSDCGMFSIGKPYCMNNSAYIDYITPECINAACVKKAEKKLFERCIGNSTCVKGACTRED